jgi:hypothetical protein
MSLLWAIWNYQTACMFSPFAESRLESASSPRGETRPAASRELTALAPGAGKFHNKSHARESA